MSCNSYRDDLNGYFNNFYCELSEDKVPGQGDLFFPYIELYYKDSEKKYGNVLGVIVLSNQCDIENDKNTFILYSHIYRAVDMLKLRSKKGFKTFQQIIQLNHPKIFYLPPHPKIDEKVGGVIYLENILSIKKELFNETYTKPTLSLNRPFIDNLANKIGILFNRVPINNPNNETVNNWIKDNIALKQISELSKLINNTNQYITYDVIIEMIYEYESFEDCQNIIELYNEASVCLKVKQYEKLEELIQEIEKKDFRVNILNKLKKDYEIS